MNILTNMTKAHLFKFLILLATQVMREELVSSDGEVMYPSDLEEVVKDFVPSEYCGGYDKNNELYEKHYAKGYKNGLTATSSDLGTPDQIQQKTEDHMEQLSALDFVFMPDETIKQIAYLHGHHTGTMTGGFFQFCKKQDARKKAGESVS